jgi:hypothetical protein
MLIICHDNPSLTVSYDLKTGKFGILRGQISLIDIGDICLRICQVLSSRSVYLREKIPSLGDIYSPLTRSSFSPRMRFITSFSADIYLECAYLELQASH